MACVEQYSEHARGYIDGGGTPRRLHFEYICRVGGMVADCSCALCVTDEHTTSDDEENERSIRPLQKKTSTGKERMR